MLTIYNENLSIFLMKIVCSHKKTCVCYCYLISLHCFYYVVLMLAIDNIQSHALINYLSIYKTSIIMYIFHFFSY